MMAECYVHGLIDREGLRMLESGKVQAQEFEIQ